MYNAEKNYKIIMDRSIRKHRVTMQNRLKSLKTLNPKAYWEIINNNNKCTNKCNVSVEEFFDYFKSVNIDVNADCIVDADIDVNNSNINFDILNISITCDEIITSVNKTKE